MKKVFLFAISLGLFAQAATAQKKYVTTAAMALNSGDYAEAKKAIDIATANEPTDKDPKAWMVKGDVYLKMEEKAIQQGGGDFEPAIQAYIKAAQLDPKYSREDLNMRLLNGALLYFNRAVIAYEGKDYKKSFNYLDQVNTIHGLEDGKRFAGNKNFDTINANAQLIKAYSAVNDEQLEKGAALLKDLKNNPIAVNASLYAYLAEVQGRLTKYDDQIVTINEGRKLYPNDKDLRDAEINYYVITGKQAELLTKLEDAQKAEPDNKIIIYNLANLYVGMAFPKDANGKDLPRPADYSNLVSNAENIYTKLLTAEPENAEYQYYTGVLFFNQTSELHNNMVAANNSKNPAENKKVDGLKKQRDEMAKKTLPYFEKAVSILEPKASSLDRDEKLTYVNGLTALKTLYGMLDDATKFGAADAKLKAVK